MSAQHEQLDLLADLEQEQADTAEHARLRAGDFTWARRVLTTGKGGRASCIFCRNSGRMDHVANGCGGTWQPRPAGPCMNQFFAGNHVRYYARGLRDRDPVVTDPSATGKRPFDEAKCRAMLAAAIDRARDRQVDVDAILAELEAER
ncbi:hypothetical protein [Georgenia sp. MJ170]|uniref:hypothetical protein n=1 Tax=Georgenia sunbinii TaxID=3117728 RepID=UPI002F261DF9